MFDNMISKYFRPIDLKSSELVKFYQLMLDALVQIIVLGDTAPLYRLSDKLFTSAEFNAMLQGTGIIDSLRQLSKIPKSHMNCALYYSTPGDVSMHNLVIQDMPFVYYTIQKVKNEDDDSLGSLLVKNIITFHYSKSDDRYILVSNFTNPLTV